MSEIRVNRVVSADGTSAPTMTYGFQVPTGIGITGAGGINITGVCTAGSLVVGSGIITASSSGVNITGVCTATTFIGAVTGDATGLSGTPNISCGTIAGSTGTFSGAVNVDATTDSTSSTTGSLIVDGGLGVAKNVYIGAGLSVAGTLTYEDVTNVDSVGLITAKSGVNVTGGQLQVGVAYSVGAAGVCTAAGFVGPLTGTVTGTGANLTAGTVPLTSLDLDGGTDIGAGLADADLFIVDDAAGGTNRKTAASRIKTYVADLTLTTAAQTAITSVGTLAGLTVGSAGEFKVGTGVTIASTSGVTTFSEGVTFLSDNNASFTFDPAASTFNALDSAYIKCGSSGDMLLFHDGSNSYIRNITGYLDIQPKSGEAGIRLNPDGAISIAYDGNFKLATTNDGTVTTGIGTFTAGANFDGILSEKFNETAGKLSDNTNIDLEDGMIHFFTTTESTTCTPNIRYSSSKSLNNMLSTGDSVTVTVITTAAAGGYSANWTVDGSAVTEEWNGGSAPAEGGSGGYDCYTITLLKTGSGAFVVLGNLSNFA